MVNLHLFECDKHCLKFLIILSSIHKQVIIISILINANSTVCIVIKASISYYHDIPTNDHIMIMIIIIIILLV